MSGAYSVFSLRLVMVSYAVASRFRRYECDPSLGLNLLFVVMKMF